MQILGKRSKVLLIAVAIVMLVVIGVSFAAWDSMSTVRASNGDLSSYANAQVGDEVKFGYYYQSRTELTKKDPITWIVVDKDERTGQLTLMSKYILACGSYFGNWYDDGTGGNWNYNKTNNVDGTFTCRTTEVGGTPYNQAYVDSTVRAYLNNLERLDLGGDSFSATAGYIPSAINSTKDGYDATITNKFVKGTELLSSVGFSNKRYYTRLNSTEAGVDKLLKNPDSGFIKRSDHAEVYYQRPINSSAYNNRPATKGFLDEAFTDEEKTMIVPKVIAGYTGHRWSDGEHDVSTKSYVEGAVDKVWLPSATELNIMNGIDWTSSPNDAWTNPSDEAGATVFEYFKNLEGEKLKSILKATRTELAKDGKAGNYSIPVYDKGTMNVKTAISNAKDINSTDYYWTRSPSSFWFSDVRVVSASGMFNAWSTHASNGGVRPCVILKY